jgi:hypothetical protein
MADIRTLKLSLLADTSQFTSNLNKAENDTRSFGDKIGDTVKKGAVAFAAIAAAAGAAAIAIGVDAVKAAIEDEKSQATLAKTLQNTTKATDAQIKATENYIDKTSRATGITDDQLRPSLDRLVRSTGDVAKAQKLQTLALDIAAGTGKDLAAVSEALGKAYDGNFGALKKLGIPLDENIIKTKNFDAATKAMSETFAGQADIAANTFAGKMARIKIAVDEAKESLGAALLPILEKVANFVNIEVVPAIEGLVAGLTGEKSIRQATLDAKGNVNLLSGELSDANESGRNLGEALRTLAETIGLVGTGSGNANPEFSKFVDNITKLVQGVNDLFDALKRLATFTGGVVDFVGLQGLYQRAESAGERFRGEPTSGGQYGTIVNVNVSGAVDKIATARTVVSAVNKATKSVTSNKFNGFSIMGAQS